MVVERVAYGEDYRLGFCGGNVLGTVTGEIETDGCIKSNPVKRLDYIQCFNVS